jgi:hypothetical protein
MGLEEMRYEDIEWTQLNQNGVRWRDFLSMTTKFHTRSDFIDQQSDFELSKADTAPRSLIVGTFVSASILTRI